MGSRLANIFGIPTVYNFIFSEIHDEYSEYKTHLLSVDFVERGKDMLQISDIINAISEKKWIELGINYRRRQKFADLDLETWISIFDALPKMTNKKIAALLNPETIQRIKEDFVAQYFFRKYVVDDADLEPRNVAIIVDRQNGGVSMGPSYDYDCILKGYSKIEYERCSKRDLQYCLQYFPETINRIMKQYKKIYEANAFGSDVNRVNGAIYNTVVDVVQYKGFSYDISHDILRNLHSLMSSYSSLIKTTDEPTA